MLLPRRRFDLAGSAIPHDGPRRRDSPAAVSGRAKGSDMNQLSRIGFFNTLRKAALHRLNDYIDRHCDSLDALIRQARADPDVDESGELRSLAGEVGAQDGCFKLIVRMRACVDELFCAFGEPIVEVDGAYMSPDINLGLSWHAARLTDLEIDIKSAFSL